MTYTDAPPEFLLSCNASDAANAAGAATSASLMLEITVLNCTMLMGLILKDDTEFVHAPLALVLESQIRAGTPAEAEGATMLRRVGMYKGAIMFKTSPLEITKPVAANIKVTEVVVVVSLHAVEEVDPAGEVEPAGQEEHEVIVVPPLELYLPASHAYVHVPDVLYITSQLPLLILVQSPAIVVFT